MVYPHKGVPAAIKNTDIDLNMLRSKGFHDVSLNDKSRLPINWYGMISIMQNFTNTSSQRF